MRIRLDDPDRADSAVAYSVLEILLDHSCLVMPMKEVKREVNLLVQPSCLEEPGRALAESQHEARRPPDATGTRTASTLGALLPGIKGRLETTALEPSADVYFSSPTLFCVVSWPKRTGASSPPALIWR